MNVEDAESVFGKRWNKWDVKEVKEFVEALEPKDLDIPFTLNLAMRYSHHLSTPTLEYFEGMVERVRLRSV